MRGGWVDRSLLYVGSNGGYWSRVNFSSMRAYILHFRSGSVDPLSSSNRSDGLSLRCVAIGS